MIIKVINDQRPIKNGQYVAFVTGLKSLNTYPKYLRIGIVINSENYEIKELSTEKIWIVYPSNIITVGDEGLLKGIKSVIEYTENI
jgi:hypothetical protein